MSEDKEPSCILNHDSIRRELRDRKLESLKCRCCGWLLSPAVEDEEDYDDSDDYDKEDS